jgi:mannose-1-phosphate guanylyltransferase
MVLAAGLGTRLRPLTDTCAKCLVPVGDRSMLAHVLDHLETAGVTRAVVNAHHRVDDVRAFLEDRAGVTLSAETELLGTAGGLVRARDGLGAGPVLVWNADVWIAVDLDALVAIHARGAAHATLVVAPRSDALGNVGLDAVGRVVRLRGEPVAGEVRSADFLGIHVIGAALRAAAPERGCLVGDVYIPALRRGARLDSVPYVGPMFDVGNLRTYVDANVAWLDARGLDTWVHPTASLATGVRLVRSVLGSGVVVSGAGTVARTVGWPGARMEAPLEDAVVTHRGHVFVGNAGGDVSARAPSTR